MKKVVIVLTLLALVLLAGCTTQVADNPQPVPGEQQVTPEQTVEEVDQMLIDEGEELDIGEML